MEYRIQTVCAWAGIVGALLLGIAIWRLAHFLPPISPNLPADEVAALYRQNGLGIRLSAVVMLFSGGFLVAFLVAISLQLRRIDGVGATAAWLQVVTGVFGFIPFVLTPLFWAAAAFRPERSAESIQLLSDCGWMSFLMLAPPALIQFVIIGVATLADRASAPLFPRWFGYYNIWTGILFVPGVGVLIFKTGPFAWDGLFAYWLPLAIFGAWLGLMSVMLLRAIESERRRG